MKRIACSGLAAFLVSSLALAATAAAAQIEPEPSGSAQPGSSSAGAEHLREIGHVKALTPFCSAVIDETRAGISILLDDDVKVYEVENVLELGDFDSNEITRHAAISKIMDEQVELRRAATRGNAQMKLLREQIKNAPTPEQAAALKDFEEALDGGLMRQKRLADRITRMWVILSNRPQIDDTQANENYNAAMQNISYYNTYQDPEGPTANLPDSVSAVAKVSADELRIRSEPIVHDEDDAADRMDAAFAPCFAPRPDASTPETAP